MSSKFAGIFDRDRPADKPSEAKEASGGHVVAPSPLPSPAPAGPPPTARRGRPSGKRSDPSFVQATCYIPEDIHRRVKIALLQEAKGQEFSELVGDLLRDWLDSRS